MSRRSRHGRRPQTNTTSAEPQAGSVGDRPHAATATVSLAGEPVADHEGPDAPPPSANHPDIAPPAGPHPAPASPRAVASAAPFEAPRSAAQAPAPAPTAPADEVAGPTSADGDAPRTTCTQAQLRRFIKSRPWIPMHELRRRFGIFGPDDEVSPVRVGDGTVFVGLPAAEARMLGELLGSGDVGFELSLDPGAPIVVGVYPMRPVPRG